MKKILFGIVSLFRWAIKWSLIGGTFALIGYGIKSYNVAGANEVVVDRKNGVEETISQLFVSETNKIKETKEFKDFWDRRLEADAHAKALQVIYDTVGKRVDIANDNIDRMNQENKVIDVKNQPASASVTKNK